MRIDVVSIFPELFGEFFAVSLMGRARESGILATTAHDLRSWTTDKHHVVDDTPFGGGGGMVMMAEPIVTAVEDLRKNSGSAKVIIPTARGPLFKQDDANRLAESEHLIFVCGHYKGIDERAFEILGAERFSIGDYVVTGGELPAMVIIDAVVRRIPGFLGNEDSAAGDSFALTDEQQHTPLLGPPVYTRPAEFRGLTVPEVLISGHHAKVDEWRLAAALKATREYRPDLLRRTKSAIN